MQLSYPFISVKPFQLFHSGDYEVAAVALVGLVSVCSNARVEVCVCVGVRVHRKPRGWLLS